MAGINSTSDKHGNTNAQEQIKPAAENGAHAKQVEKKGRRGLIMIQYKDTKDRE